MQHYATERCCYARTFSSFQRHVVCQRQDASDRRLRGCISGTFESSRVCFVCVYASRHWLMKSFILSSGLTVVTEFTMSSLVPHRVTAYCPFHRRGQRKIDRCFGFGNTIEN